jgi:hypothetical protein
MCECGCTLTVERLCECEDELASDEAFELVPVG